MNRPILELVDFSKSFRSHWTYRRLPAVNGISLAVEEGEAFGFLGHNGAGKTTTIKCIVGLIHKSGGRILFEGGDISGSERAAIGYLPELPYFYDHLSVVETLTFFAALHGMIGASRTRAVGQTLERVGLADRGRSPVRSLSKGLQQRLGLAQAIINRPRLLLLDEPFSGLDPIGRMDLRKIILEMKREGTSILLSSHILSDVENICDRVSIMTRGVIKTLFRLSEAGTLFGESYSMTIDPHSADSTLLQSIAAGAAAVSGGHYSFDDYTRALTALKTAAAAGVKIIDFSSRGPDLETIYLKITEQSGAAAPAPSAGGRP